MGKACSPQGVRTHSYPGGVAETARFCGACQDHRTSADESRAIEIDIEEIRTLLSHGLARFVISFNCYPR